MSDEPAPARRASDTATGVDPWRHFAPGTTVAGRYRVLSIAGVGGMGVVYKAHDQELDLDVALKVLRPDLGDDPQWLDRFRRELVLAREVTHKNVVRIHDIGESDGVRFLTMRFVEGQSLQKVLDESGRQPLERALAVVRQVAEALQQAHSVGVVHRDLKPGNILLGDDGTAYITDFGVARSLQHDGLTVTGAIVGTPDYLAPEQACGEPVDGRADLYALGVVLYETLTAELPFGGDTQAEMLAQRITGHARDIRRTGVEVPAYVRGIIARCLERHPSRRYQDAGELLRDVDRQQVSGRRWVRWPLPAAAVAAVLVLAALWSAWHWRGARSATPAAPSGQAAPTPAVRSVAVLPLADDTGDPSLAWTGNGVADMLAARLAESPDLRVLDPVRVLRTLKALQLSGGRYDDAGLKRIAEILEADRLVAGSIRRAGQAVRLDLSLISAGPAGTMAAQPLAAEAPGIEGLFGLVTGLGAQLRERLGAASPVAAEAPGPGTSSLDAALAYRQGRDRLLVGDALGAAPPLEKAVTLDPRFAVALERLAETYQQLGYHDKALAAAEQAAVAAGPVETRLGYRVRARLALLKGEPAEAEKSYGELVRRYPHDSEALLDLASAQSAQGDLTRAIETLQRAAALDRNDPRIWYLLGRNAILTGSAAKAAGDYLVRALALYTQLGNEQGQADVENALGIAYHAMGEYKPALEKYGAAAEKRSRLGDRRGVAASRKNRARTYTVMGRLDEAEPDLREALAIYEAIGDTGGLADTWNEYGVLREARGQFASARQAYQEALKLRRSLGDERALAQSYDNVGYVFMLEGEYDNALVYVQQALDRRQRIGDEAGAVQSLQSIGFLQTALGRWSDAMKTFVDALQKARQVGMANAVAVSQGNIGLLQHYEGRSAAALASLDEALATLRPLDDKRGLTEYTLRQAAVLLDLGALQPAGQKLDAAAVLLRATANKEQSSDHQLLLARWHLRRGQREEARRAFARAREEASSAHARAALLRARLGAAEAALDAGEAPADLEGAAAEAETLGEAELRVRAAALLSRARLAQRRTAEAEAAARRAIRLAGRSGWDAELFRLHALLGRVLERKGDTRGALAQYEESARRIDALRTAAPQDLRAAFDSQPEAREVREWLSRHRTAASHGD